MSNVELIHGDCLEQMAKLPAGSVDMVLTDLPYGTTRNRWDSIIPLDELWPTWKHVCKPGAPIVLFTQQPFTTVVAASNILELKTEWIWEKPQGTNFLNSRKYPMKVHENIIVFCSELPPYNPQMAIGTPYVSGKDKGSSNYGQFDGDRQYINFGTRYPRSVMQFTPERGLHPTQKPLALCEYLIRTYSNTRDVVLDCCMGSGTTGVAALNTGRSFIGIERDASYFALAEQRMSGCYEGSPVSGFSPRLIASAPLRTSSTL